MGFACSRAEGAAILVVDGEMDIDTTGEFARAALEALSDCRDFLVVDLSGLTFLDCAGVGALLTMRRRALSRGVQLTVRGATGPVQRLLRMTGVEELFQGDPTIVLPETSEQRLQLPG